MELLLASFVAGLLTVLAPCAITLLPVIIGGSVQTGHKYRPLIVAASLGISVFVFTLFLKVIADSLFIPDIYWKVLSGVLLIFVGLTLLFPLAWTKLAIKLKLYKSEELLHKNAGKEDLKSTILLGASLGPVFTTCSPTFLLIVATVFPQSFWTGMINLLAYTLGLVLLLLVVGYVGQTAVKKLKFAVNPDGWFKKIISILLILVGLAVITGFDKTIEIWLLDNTSFSNLLFEVEDSLMPQNLTP